MAAAGQAAGERRAGQCHRRAGQRVRCALGQRQAGAGRQRRGRAGHRHAGRQEGKAGAGIRAREDAQESWVGPSVVGQDVPQTSMSAPELVPCIWHRCQMPWELPAPTLWDHVSVFQFAWSIWDTASHPKRHLGLKLYLGICFPCKTYRKMMCTFVAP